MAMKTLDDLFVHMLRDMYYAERQILKALPKMAEKAKSDKLRDAFETHEKETEEHVDRLSQIFEMRDLKPRGVTCEAIDGIIEESKEIMSEADDPEVRDAAMIAAAQAVEHYEMTRYGTMIAWAQQLGMDDAVKLLKQTLEQEKHADNLLTELAEDRLNRKAA
jgi:ferritin-like metal-binding protein YciE